MKLTILFVIIYFTSSAYSLDMAQEDKQKHVAVSTAMSMPTYLTMRANKYNRFQSAAMAIGLTLLVGHMKETNDIRYDQQDMGANAVGALGGVVLPLSFNF